MRSTITATSLSLAAVLALCGCEAVQPEPACTVVVNPYAAKYFLKKMSGACDGKIVTGELLYLGYFRDAKDYAENPASIAIEAESVHNAVTADETITPMGEEYAMGKFTSKVPDAKELCSVPTFSDQSITVGDTKLSYKWSNFKIINTAVSHAIHFGADLVRKDGDCEAEYAVSAASPSLYCGDGVKPKVDEMGKEIPGETEPDPTTGKPVEDACEEVDITKEEPKGFNPSLELTCDATADGKGSHLCVPKNEFPSLK